MDQIYDVSVSLNLKKSSILKNQIKIGISLWFKFVALFIWIGVSIELQFEGEERRYSDLKNVHEAS